jgi:hypothetical protein
MKLKEIWVSQAPQEATRLLFDDANDRAGKRHRSRPAVHRFRLAEVRSFNQSATGKLITQLGA